MKQVPQNYRRMKVADLELHPGNPRKGDLAVIGESIDTSGFYGAVVVQKSTRRVLAGNHRLMAARERGAKSLPVIEIDVDDETALRILLADNKTSDAAEYDDEALFAALKQLGQETGSLEGSGYAQEDYRALERRLVHFMANANGREDKTPPVPKRPQSKRGTIYELGTHRVMCGDARDGSAWAELLGDASGSLVLTDPPYGVDIQEPDLVQAEIRGRRKDGKGIANDDLSGSELAEFLRASFGTIAGATKPGAVWYVFAPSGVDYRHSLNALAELGIARHGLVWLKDRFVMGRADYHYRHENVIYGWTPGGPHRPLDRRDLDSVLEYPRPAASPEHPTMKPVAMLADLVARSSEPGDVVIDGFAGSGSTLVACEMTGRQCFAMELDPAYVDVIRKRYEDLQEAIAA